MINLTEKMDNFLKLLKKGFKNKYKLDSNLILEYNKYGFEIGLSNCECYKNCRIPKIHAIYLIENNFMELIGNYYYPSMEQPSYNVCKIDYIELLRYDGNKYPEKTISFLKEKNKKGENNG